MLPLQQLTLSADFLICLISSSCRKGLINILCSFWKQNQSESGITNRIINSEINITLYLYTSCYVCFLYITLILKISVNNNNNNNTHESHHAASNKSLGCVQYNECLSLPRSYTTQLSRNYIQFCRVQVFLN